MTEIQGQKMYLHLFFTAKCCSFFIRILHFQFFLYDLIANKLRKPEDAESNLIIENVPSALFLSVLGGVSFLLFLAYFLSLALSLSLSNSFVDAALQPLLCGVISSINLTSCPFNYAEASLTKLWLATDEANFCRLCFSFHSCFVTAPLEDENNF